jgi:hypothetical protein
MGMHFQFEWSGGEIPRSRKKYPDLIFLGGGVPYFYKLL